MNIKSYPVFAVFAAMLIGTANPCAAVTVVQSPSGGAVPGQFQPMVFSDSKEAGMLRSAYLILATGDHDYKGHRAKAMHAVEAAADLLGINIRGDDKDRQPQVLSDDKLREALGLLQNVLGATEVKSQKPITRHINVALSLK